MAEHNVNSFATSLSAKLATRSRHVCTFFGAGISKACGLPNLDELKTGVLAALNDAERAILEHQIGAGTLEQGLTRIRRIAALLGDDQEFDGLTKAVATALDAKICETISGLLDLSIADPAAVDMIASWAAHCSYLRPLEIFTVNYDLLLETALERKRVPYFDGFIGSVKARFYTEFVEASGDAQIPPFFVRLWKLHGSVNWQWEEKDVVRMGKSVDPGTTAAIYPSDAKYEESRRVPFVVLQDRFRRALNEPETLVLVSGYSFGDDHLNELIYDAALKHERSEFIIFCFDPIPAELALRASSIPNLQVVTKNEAILGGVRGAWTTPEADKTNPMLWQDGEFILRDFRKLSHYLALSSPNNLVEE